MDPIQQQQIIIGVTIGGIAFLVIVAIIIVCVCCRKTERSILKRSLKRMEKKHAKDKYEMTVQQRQRHEEMERRHAEIRDKYGLNKNNDELRPNPTDNIFSVENEKISSSLR